MNSGDPSSGMYQFVQFMELVSEKLVGEMKESCVETISAMKKEIKAELKAELKYELVDELLEVLQESSSDTDDSSSSSESDSSGNSSNSRKRPAFDDEIIGEPTDRPHKRWACDPDGVPKCIYGMTLANARNYLKGVYPSINYTIRPCIVDGKAHGLTCDYIPTRINVIVRNGVIVEKESYLGKMMTCWFG